jgi:hypothetical protein
VFQDELLSPDQREPLHDCYRRMADAVAEGLRSYLWVVDHLHKRFLASGKDTHTVPALLLMEYAERIDGVSILARTGSAKNCVPLIRSGFELQLNLMYMLERDDVYEDRCLAYELFHWTQQLKTATKCDPASAAGKQVRSQIRGGLLADAFDHPGQDIAGEIKAHRKLLDHPRYAAVKTEYERSKPKHWYGMWSGPNNLEQLAAALDRLAHYEVMYRYWSAYAHGESALKRLVGGEKPQMDPVRSPRGLPTACLHACNLATEMAAFVVGRFVPGVRDELAARYRGRVKPGVDYIQSVRGLEG